MQTANTNANSTAGSTAGGQSKSIRALVLRTAGTNCDRETVQALELAGAEVQLTHLYRVLEKPGLLDDVEIVVIAGGFSYGDDIAAGRILSLDVRRNLGEALPAFVARGGFLLGVCNGFQVLVDTGLLEPGAKRTERRIALTGNDPGLYQCRWITMRVQQSAVPWLTEDFLLSCPVAHGEGRIVLRDPDADLADLETRSQVALRYVNQDGSPADGYPQNPNGSFSDIAGLCDPTGRVLGLMPHPERHIHPWQYPLATRSAQNSSSEAPEAQGLTFYRQLVEAARASLSQSASL